jgi:translation initiation factor IF-2
VDDEDPASRDRCRRAAAQLGPGHGQPAQGGAAWTAAEARTAAGRARPGARRRALLGTGRGRGAGLLAGAPGDALESRAPARERRAARRAGSARRRVGGKEVRWPVGGKEAGARPVGGGAGRGLQWGGVRPVGAGAPGPWRRVWGGALGRAGAAEGGGRPSGGAALLAMVGGRDRGRRLADWRGWGRGSRRLGGGRKREAAGGWEEKKSSRLGGSGTM